MAENKKNEWDEREIGAFWIKEGKDFFTGTINGEKVVVFPNKHKEKGDNKPNYRVYKESANYASPKKDDDLPL